VFCRATACRLQFYRLIWSFCGNARYQRFSKLASSVTTPPAVSVIFLAHGGYPVFSRRIECSPADSSSVDGVLPTNFPSTLISAPAGVEVKVTDVIDGVWCAVALLAVSGERGAAAGETSGQVRSVNADQFTARDIARTDRIRCGVSYACNRWSLRLQESDGEQDREKRNDAPGYFIHRPFFLIALLEGP
jgi:hypothetical protein